MEGFADVPAYLRFKTLMRCIEGWMMGFTQSGWGESGGAGQAECMCAFHCSAVQKIITDGAPCSRDFPAAAVGGEAGRDVHLKMKREAAGTRGWGGGERRKQGTK